MPTLTIEYATDAERLQYERAIAYVRELNHLGATAAPGAVLDTCELFALEHGRQLLRDHLQAAIQARVDAPKKCPATGPKDSKAGR